VYSGASQSSSLVFACSREIKSRSLRGERNISQFRERGNSQKFLVKVTRGKNKLGNADQGDIKIDRREMQRTGAELMQMQCQRVDLCEHGEGQPGYTKGG
jgi:hypothetical protein